jgi:tetratricopeptide (TPR) repeat protein
MQIDDIFHDVTLANRAIPTLDALARTDIRSALTSARALFAEDPEIAGYSYILSEVLLIAGRTDEAFGLAIAATDAAPDNPLFTAHYAHCLLHLGRFDEALTQADASLANNPHNVSSFHILGVVYTACGELGKALDMARESVAIAPDNTELQFNLATALRSAGHLEEAESIYDKLIDAAPSDWELYRNRADLRRQTPERNHLAQLETMLPATQGNARGRYQLLGALAKELSDLGDYQRSFAHLKESADLRRRMLKYDVAGDVETMSALAAAFSQTICSGGQGAGLDECEEPIFIVGLPRTGSTLLERMLGSHSDVFAAGELQNFAIELVKLAKSSFAGQPLDKLSLVAKSTQLDFSALGRRYLDSTRPRTGNSRFFIDKMPLNFLYIGLIHLALPRARIIHLTRHPMDACYAIYKTPFDQAYPYSYDLQDLGRYYIAYRKLMAHWHAVMPGAVLDVAYEDLVGDTEGTLRQVINYCDLDWQPACLNFHENTSPTNTASAAQVRQPVYNSSVDKWRQLEQELAPLSNILVQAGIEI